MKNPCTHWMERKKTTPRSTNDDRNEKRRWGKKHWEQQQQQQKKREQLTVYRSKTNVSCIQLLLYNVSNNVQRLKDFHHFFFAFHSLLLFRCFCFVVFFLRLPVRLALLLSWVVGAIFLAACKQQPTAATVNPNRVHQWQRHIIIVKLRINSFKHYKMKLIFFSLLLLCARFLCVCVCAAL